MIVLYLKTINATNFYTKLSVASMFVHNPKGYFRRSRQAKETKNYTQISIHERIRLLLISPPV